VIDVSLGRFTGMASGIEATARAAIVWTLADGKVVRFEFHQDRESALASAREERPPTKG
jgi:ketosteroid isomerase-like protein